jgi:hypothetical protein
MVSLREKGTEMCTQLQQLSECMYIVLYGAVFLSTVYENANFIWMQYFITSKLFLLCIIFVVIIIIIIIIYILLA